MPAGLGFDTSAVFAPPPNECGHWVVPASLRNGSQLDAFSLLHAPHAPRTPPAASEIVRAPRVWPSRLLWFRFHEVLYGGIEPVA